jgi:hypothetical protein
MRLIRLLFLSLLPFVAAEEKPDRATEKEMAQRPLEAFVIARRAADKLGDQPEAVKHLFAVAAKVQEDHLSQLSEDQVAELASVYTKTLADPGAAQRVQRRWLKGRREDLGPADGPGRVALARLYWQWLHDRTTAGQLCQEALRVAPEHLDAARILKEDLHYRRAEAGWLPREEVEPASRRRNVERVHAGMAADQVRKLLGEPSRTSRQILFRRYVEQWTYEDPPGLWIELNCLKGEEAHVLAVHAPAGR